MESSLIIDNKCDNNEIRNDSANEATEANTSVNCENSEDLNNETLVNQESKKTTHVEVEEKIDEVSNFTSSTLNGFKKHKPRKRIAIADSDSDSEGNLHISDNNIYDTTSQNSTNDNSDLPDISKSKIRKHVTVLRSDSEDEDFDMKASKNITSKKAAILDSDSEDEVIDRNSPGSSKKSSDLEDNILQYNTIKSTNTKKKVCTLSSESDDEELKKKPNKKGTGGKQKRNKKGPVVNNTDDEDITTHKSDNELETSESTVFKSSRWSALCDSESSADELNQNDGNKSDVDQDGMLEEVPKPIRYRRKPKSKKETGPKEMTGKEALEQRKEIFSESQRMTRQSNVSLPYHRPKSHSLREFLARRPKLASALPLVPKTPPCIAMKMSMEQLEVISKKFEERHKEVEEFYKSESEKDDSDEDKNDVDYVPESENQPFTDNNENVTLLKEDSVSASISKDEELENICSKTLDANESITINDKIDDKNDNDNYELMEIINTEVVTQEVVTSDGTFCEVERVDKSDNTNSSVSQINKEVEENIGNNISMENIQSDIRNVESEQESMENIKSDNRNVESEQESMENIQSDNRNVESEQESMENIQSDNRNVESEQESMENIQSDNRNVESEQESMENIQSDNRNVVSEQESMENIQSNNRSVESEQESMEYEFNLDDMEEHSERFTKLDNQPESGYEKDLEHESQDGLEEQSIEIQQQTIDFSELDKEIENFTRNAPPQQEKPKLSKMELLKERLSNIKPRLSSSANNIIDLDNIAKPAQVIQLMERFAKHTAKKEHHKDKVQVNIVNVESGGEIHKETFSVHIDDEEDTSIEEKPGVRLQRLRNELQTQIAQQKHLHWKNKNKIEVKNVVNDDDPHQDERSECGADDSILDNDEEEEMSESSEDEDGDEEELEDETTDEPKRKKSAFVDDEVEETDNEDEDEIESKDRDREADENTDADNEEEMEENEDEIDENVEDNSDEENYFEENNKGSENKENEHNGEKEEEKTFKKPLRRIIKCFTEDSDDDDDDDDDIQLSSVVSKIAEKLNKSNEESNSTTQDDYIPPYQLQNQNTPVRQTFRDKSDLKFLTPVSYITGLQNLTNSVSKVHSPTNVPSPLREANWHATLQKKLFADSVITNSQAEAMAQLCSESFSNSQVSTQDNSTSNSATENDSALGINRICPPTSQNHRICTDDSQDAPSTQDLLDVCSGEFTGISQISSIEYPISHVLNPVEEVKTLDEDQDMVISQLINEEEMEAFKKKFDSPILINSPKVIKETEEVAATGGVIDSDDDDDNVIEVKKKKNQKKLTFSDDDSSDEEKEEEEGINLHDEGELDDEDELDNEDVQADINYDSEENEIEYEKESENIKLTDFFEDEAELSESEWGSADEDEKDLDTLEFEQGDAEKFDEKQMRTDLERIHMRRMLDDDTREVKLLQEMLLDDGELHGSGRERQFKWKNIDSQDTADDTRRNSDDEIGFDEDESEEQWRRKRHEREMFLKEKQSQELNDDVDLLSKSEILKLGHKVIQKSLSNPQGNTVLEKTKDENESSSLKTHFSLQHKRGSFLNRGDEVLQKLAEYNKLSTTTTTTAIQKAKNSKNFLFQTIEVQATTEKLSIFSKKRKATDGIPKVIKKLRLSDNLSPAVKKKNKSNAKSKLFAVS